MDEQMLKNLQEKQEHREEQINFLENEEQKKIIGNKKPINSKKPQKLHTSEVLIYLV